MANPEAVMRAAIASPKPMSGQPMDTPGDDAQDMAGQDPQQGVAVGMKDIGEYIQAASQSGKPGADKAMEIFRALLKGLSDMESGAATPEQAAPSEEPKAPGRLHESQFPGVQVM